ncbi:hemolysin secretion protein D [Azorhizobium oxalatiphilum]|uniref:Hemolysin secretion protein D n=1 Tax=Azorhizobium oxalatiphilum TaxID=980631 RepID=A0A917C929_9HYPH|nr:efflux RND transporter periplasmic adaptor subunit [Azorhizobium oxalatiphilum]GGF77951.1 hemolysin secretion protein D [Azorhizobium oxalatiphilum]
MPRTEPASLDRTPRADAAPGPEAVPLFPATAPPDAPGRKGSGGRPPRRKGRWLLAAALLLLLGGFWYYRSANTVRPADAYTSAAAAAGDIEESVLATGILKPVRFVAVGAQASGRLLKMHVKLGQVVKAGDLIAEIDDLTQQNALRTAEADLANMRAQREEKQVTLKYAELTLARQTRMLTQTITSQADYETAASTVGTTRAQIAALDAQIASAEVAVETARVNLGYTRITAPTDGTILALVTQEGQTVNASQSAPTIAILGDVGTMTVRTEISEADVVKVKPGQAVYFTILGAPDQPYHATLESIEPAPESVKSDSSFSSTSTASSSSSSSSSSTSSAIYYNGVFNVPNPDGKLRTYMTAEVHIVLGSAKGVLTIPAAALGTVAADGSYAVQVIKSDGTLEPRTVTIGLNDKVTAEVKSGLKAGERVVTGRRSASGAATQQGGPPPPPGM